MQPKIKLTKTVSKKECGDTMQATFPGADTAMQWYVAVQSVIALDNKRNYLRLWHVFTEAFQSMWVIRLTGSQEMSA